MGNWIAAITYDHSNEHVEVDFFRNDRRDPANFQGADDIIDAGTVAIAAAITTEVYDRRGNEGIWDTTVAICGHFVPVTALAENLGGRGFLIVGSAGR